MSGKRLGRSGSKRRYPATVATAVTALVTQSCGLVEGNHNGRGDSSQQTAGSFSQGGSGGGSHSSSGSGAGGTVSGAGGTGLDLPMCPDTVPPVDQVPFFDQVLSAIGEVRTLYSWTTDEQVAELRAGGELFSRSERAGMGRGLLFTELAAYAAANDGATVDDEQYRKLAGILGTQVFAKARFAWPNPWATLMGFPGESYGNQLLRIELKREAWVAIFDGRVLSVVDAENQAVPIETALASPERIGAIFYASRANGERNYCGTFSHGSVSFREYALGNIEMVARWSLATQEIAERLKRDVAQLKLFEASLRCLDVAPGDGWANGISCDWGYNRTGAPGSALNNYEAALAMPSELYWPSPENVEAIIAALEMSMPTGAPLDVRPSP